MLRAPQLSDHTRILIEHNANQRSHASFSRVAIHNVWTCASKCVLRFTNILTPMKLQLASDLHLEFLGRSFPSERLISPAPEADILVVAGDVSNGTKAIELFMDWPVPVLYLAGNHEFYGRDFEETRAALRKASEGTSVHYLDNDVVKFAGVIFLGTTLWTDYRLDPKLTQGHAMQIAERAINDHRLIRYDGGFFTAQRALSEHERSRSWLAKELSSPYDGRTVVVTHHGPHASSVHPRFQGSPVNPAFISDLSELLPKAHLWLHGHVHDSLDYQVGGCRVVANPLGYPTNAGSARRPQDLVFENKAFRWDCVLDVS